MELAWKLEENLKSEVLLHLNQGKPNWDIPHTLACVYWIRKLIEKEKGNEKILVTTMYLHDIGYPKLREGYDFEDLMKSKLTHEEASAIESKKILIKLGKYSVEEINEIVDLVRYHDTLTKLDTRNRWLVMEADSLAAIDWERVTPNFDKENCRKYLKHFKETRVNKFHTETGKIFLNQLLERAEKYCK